MRRLLFVILLIVGFPVVAQNNRLPDLEPLPAPPPPPPGMASDAELEPQVTIKQRGEDRVEEYRVNGKLYMIKVMPRVGAPYHLVDEKGEGTFTRREGFEKSLRVPQWVIKTW